MAFTTLVSVSELKAHIQDENWAAIDCRFSLDDTERGQKDYLEAHIPGAVYAHMDRDLSGKKMAGKTGRHPLPEPAALAETLSAWGIDGRTQVVAYDDAAGFMAARLWWLLQWMGHANAALLDGGWQAWQGVGLRVAGGPEQRPRRSFRPVTDPGAHVAAAEVERCRKDPRCRILDARGAARFRGEMEPIDAVAGHIPGAVSAPCEENVDAEGRFLAPEILRARYEKLMKTVPPGNVICYCGSGVTAAHDILAIAHSGLGRARLYAGSWSEWITDPSRPVATEQD